MSWVNIKSAISLRTQNKVFFINKSSRGHLLNTLSNLGFKIYVLDGEKINSELDFFNEIAKIFEFPNYFGKNWDAFYDCLGDFDGNGNPAIALIWDNTTSTINNSLYVFVRCLTELVALPENYRRDPDPEGVSQFEVFFIGDGDEFLILTTDGDTPKNKGAI